MAARLTVSLWIILSLGAIGGLYQTQREQESRLETLEAQLKRQIPRQTLSAAQSSDANQMLALAQAGYDAFVRLGNARPGRPDLIDLQITWSRKILCAQLALHPTGPEHEKALQSHRDRMAALAAKTHLIHDATAAAIAQVDHAQAEAEYLIVAEQ
jgi:hypothetical protein